MNENIEIFEEQIDAKAVLQKEVGLSKWFIIAYQVFVLYIITKDIAVDIFLTEKINWIFTVLSLLILYWILATCFFYKNKKWAWWSLFILNTFSALVIICFFVDTVFAEDIILENQIIEPIVIMLISLFPLPFLLRRKMRQLFSIIK